jgi:hypothetical protein
MTEQCSMCGKFMAYRRLDDNHCDVCCNLLTAEYNEAETGIGNGQACNMDENYCRHGIERMIIA